MIMQLVFGVTFFIGTAWLLIGLKRVRDVPKKPVTKSKARCLLCGRFLPLDGAALRDHSRRYHHEPLSPEDMEDW
jgi:hypothetical protein